MVDIDIVLILAILISSVSAIIGVLFGCMCACAGRGERNDDESKE